MDIKWSYYIIAALYGIIILLKVLNANEQTQFKKTDSEALVYKIYKKDFFYTIAVVCTAITVLINGVSILAGKPLVIESIIITLLIVGMAYLTGNIEMLTTAQGTLLIDGTKIEMSNIKEVIIKEKKEKTQYHILFEQPINGYEGIEFALKGEKQKEFTQYININ